MTEPISRLPQWKPCGVGPPCSRPGGWCWSAVLQAWRGTWSHVPHSVSSPSGAPGRMDSIQHLASSYGYDRHLGNTYLEKLNSFCINCFSWLFFIAEIMHSNYLKWKWLNNLKKYILLGLELFFCFNECAKPSVACLFQDSGISDEILGSLPQFLATSQFWSSFLNHNCNKNLHCVSTHAQYLVLLALKRNRYDCK